MSDEPQPVIPPIQLNYARPRERGWTNCAALTQWLLIVTGIMSTLSTCNSVLLGIDAVGFRDFDESRMFAPTGLLFPVSGFLTFVFSVPFVTLFCSWHFRVLNNARFETLDSRLRYGGWHVLSWFVPVWNLIVPVREFYYLQNISTEGTSHPVRTKWFIVWYVAWVGVAGTVVLRLALGQMGRSWNTLFMQSLVGSLISLELAVGFGALLHLISSISHGQFERWAPLPNLNKNR